MIQLYFNLKKLKCISNNKYIGIFLGILQNSYFHNFVNNRPHYAQSSYRNQTSTSKVWAMSIILFLVYIILP